MTKQQNGVSPAAYDEGFDKDICLQYLQKVSALGLCFLKWTEKPPGLNLDKSANTYDKGVTSTPRRCIDPVLSTPSLHNSRVTATLKLSTVSIINMLHYLLYNKKYMCSEKFQT